MSDYIKQRQKHTRKQQLREARRKSGLRSQKKKPRIKKVTSNDWDDLDEMEFDTYQPIVSKIEHERRREVEKAISHGSNVESSGVVSRSNEATPNSTRGTSALVVETSSGICRVDLDGEIILCDIRGNIKDAVTGYVNPVAVGDRVLISKNGTERGVVEAVLPRRSVLARPYSPDQGKVLDDLYQIVAANVDRLLIVASWREPYFWPALVDRYLITAQRNQIQAVICINKVDLIDDQSEFQATIQPYQNLGYQVVFTSTVTGVGIDEVEEMLREHTTVLAGLSGVGKSSILTAIQPSLNLKTGNVSERGLFTGQGQHTTTQASLLKLENGGIVIDTPGVRTFGIAGIAQGDLSSWYSEMVPLSGQCRFGNCTHTTEPDCAVKAAVKDGLITDLRYKNYTQILDELSA
ncbi:ribosome small subunit-dependent GTPase A [Chloroflexota bacterium]